MYYNNFHERRLYQILSWHYDSVTKIDWTEKLRNNFEDIDGMLRHALGGAVMFLSLQHFIAPALDLTYLFVLLSQVK